MDKSKTTKDVPKETKDVTKDTKDTKEDHKDEHGYNDTLHHILEELYYKFSDLPNMRPDNVKSHIDIFETALKDDTVHNFNPQRYATYMELNKQIKNNPEIFKNINYENQLIETKKQDEAKTVQDIVSKQEQLYAVTNKGIRQNDNAYKHFKKNKIEKESDQIVQRLQTIMGDEYPDKKTEIEKIVKDTFGVDRSVANVSGDGNNSQGNVPGSTSDDMPGNDNGQSATDTSKNTVEKDTQTDEPKGENKNGSKYDTPPRSPDRQHRGGAPPEEDSIKEAEQAINSLKERFENKRLLKKYTKDLKDILEAPSSDDKLKAQKLKDLLNDIEENDIASIKSLTLSKEDKLVFIGLSFMIRLIVLMIVDWALTSNFIVTFTQAYMLYVGLYSVVVLLFVVIVNITYTLPVYDMYTGEGVMTSLASSLYFFYLIPGNMMAAIKRIALHLFVILAVSLLALFIVGNTKTPDQVLSFDYSEKKKIRSTLSHYTLILWFITSGLAYSAS